MQELAQLSFMGMFFWDTRHCLFLLCVSLCFYLEIMCKVPSNEICYRVYDEQECYQPIIQPSPDTGENYYRYNKQADI
nr:MAG TPA: hypothetical protein [Caudoviricetes sp.]